MKNLYLTKRYVQIFLVAVFLEVLASFVFAVRPRVPAPPPEGQMWVWVSQPHWELVAAAPPGPYQWRAGYWDINSGIWIDGTWIIMDDRPGYYWTAGYYDSGQRSWHSGRWQAGNGPSNGRQGQTQMNGRTGNTHSSMNTHSQGQTNGKTGTMPSSINIPGQGQSSGRTGNQSPNSGTSRQGQSGRISTQGQSGSNAGHAGNQQNKGNEQNKEGQK